MITLPEKFESGVGGFSQDPLTYTQVIRKGQFAVYERSRRGKVKDYEVITIKVVPKGYKIFDTVSTEDKEFYSSNNDFGRTAWSYYSLEAAMRKFDDLTKSPEVIKETKKDITAPAVLFTVTDLAQLNKVNYLTAANWIKVNLGKTVKFVEEKRLQTKGKPSKFYQKI